MTDDELFTHGFYAIPDPAELAAMSFAELAAALSSAEKESPKFMVIERELKKVLARDQAELNRKNVVRGALIGGAFGLLGVALGAYLRAPASCVQATPAVTVPQPQPGSSGSSPQIGSVKPIQSESPRISEPVRSGGWGTV